MAEAFIIGKDFIKDDSVCLILGDNLFYGSQLSDLLMKAREKKIGASLFGYEVKDPERYGVWNLILKAQFYRLKKSPSVQNLQSR